MSETDTFPRRDEPQPAPVAQWIGVFLAPAAPGDTTHTERRLTFTPLSKDLVRQHGETSSDQGRSWRTSYDLYYHRKR